MIFDKWRFLWIIPYWFLQFVMNSIRMQLIRFVSRFRGKSFAIMPSLLMSRVYVFGCILLIVLIVMFLLGWLVFIHILIRGCFMSILICDDHLHKLLMSNLSLILVTWTYYTFINIFIRIVQIIVMCIIVFMHWYWWIIL